MSVRELLLKHQSVLTEVKPCLGSDLLAEDQAIAGNFGPRAAAFGVRKAKDGSENIFFKVAIKPAADLPQHLREDCFLEFHAGSEFENADVRIEDSQWLTERVRPEEAAADYFAAQTDVLIRDRMTALSRLAAEIDAGDFSLWPSIQANTKMNIRRVAWLLVGGFLVIALSVAAASAWFVGWPVKISEVKVEHPGSVSLGSTQVARARARRAMSERSIMPPGSYIFMTVTPDRTSVRLDEKVTLLYEVVTRYSTQCWGFYNEGKFRNFTAVRKDPAADTSREVVRVNGKKYLKFAVGTVSLVPQRNGEQIIYPGTAFVSAQAESGKILDVYLTSQPIRIDVGSDAGPGAK